MTGLRMVNPEVTGVATTTHTVREIVLAHGRYVWRLLRYFGVDDRDLDDVCQDVFLTAFRKLDDLSDDGLRPWLRTISFNHARAYRRRLHRHREMLVDDLPESHFAPVQEKRLEVAQAQQLLLAFLDGLNEETRTIVVLHAIEELPMDQVAKIVGCPLSTAYSRFHRARTELETKMVNP